MSDQGEAARRSTRSQSAADSHATTAGNHNKPEKDFQEFVRQSLVQKKLDQVLVNQQALENRLSKLEPEVERNSSDIKKVIKSLDFESERMNANESDVSDIQRDVTSQKSEADRLAALVNSLQSQVLDLQRYTLGFNIRIFGIPEAPGESCKDVVDGLLKINLTSLIPPSRTLPALDPALKTGRNRLSLASIVDLRAAQSWLLLGKSCRAQGYVSLTILPQLTSRKRNASSLLWLTSIIKT